MSSTEESIKLVASTGTRYSVSISQSNRLDKLNSATDSGGPSSAKSDGGESELESNYFKSLQWSPDGTCLLTNSVDNILRTFIVPPDLLSTNSSLHHLSAYSSIHSPEPVYAITPYPYFSLAEPSTALILSSVRDHPIRLSNALSPIPSSNGILASYPLINPSTEAYLTPSSLLFQPSGTHLLAGTDSLITLFDVSRSGCGPILELPTIPSKRHKMKGGGVGMRGIVSCLSLQPTSSMLPTSDVGESTSMLAAGTWTRWVSLYDAAGMGGTVANWSIASAADLDAKIGGAGVAQTLWSACGRYLFVAERKSRGILTYDVRVTGKLVSWLDGRNAETNQRLGVDVFLGQGGGSEIWAGGMDGGVMAWMDVEMTEGGKTPDIEWMAHGSAVSGCAVHASGSVVATSSGNRRTTSPMSIENSSDDSSEQESDSSIGRKESGYSRISSSDSDVSLDNSIKIWSLL